MLFGILADIIVFIHFLWIVFLLFGCFIGVRYRAVKIMHIAGLVFALTIQVFGWYCPLTHLEGWLRVRHDPSLAYSGSFIINYLERIVYLEVSADTLFRLTIMMIIFNIWMYMRRKRS